VYVRVRVSACVYLCVRVCVMFCMQLLAMNDLNRRKCVDVCACLCLCLCTCVYAYIYIGSLNIYWFSQYVCLIDDFHK